MTPETLECGALARSLLLLARLPGGERTGIIIGERLGAEWRCGALVAVRNTSPDPGASFTMDPWGVVVAHTAAENLGLEPVAVFHTHPCGPPRPSTVDERFMRLWPMPWVIASPRGLAAWVLPGEGSPRRVPIA